MYHTFLQSFSLLGVVSQKYQDKKVKKKTIYICCLCLKIKRKSNHLVPLLDVVRVKPGHGLVKVFDIEVHKSATLIFFSMRVTFVLCQLHWHRYFIISIYLSSSPSQSPLLSSSPTSPPPSSSSTLPCILCQPAHLVLGELHHLRLPPLLVLLPVLLVHHHLGLEISRKLLNLSLNKFYPEKSYAISQTNLRCRVGTLCFLTLGLCLSKGPATTGISRNERNCKGVHAMGVTVKLFLKKLCPERSQVKLQRNLCSESLFQTWIVLAKGTGNNWNQQKWKEGSYDNKSLSDKPDIGTRLNTFKRRAKKAKVILRNA